jgi:hypothetical protein
MRVTTAIAIILIAAPALAEQKWLSAEDFEAQVTGRATQVFNQGGGLFGTEYFLPKRRVIWQLAGETRCYPGVWAVQDRQICFRYEGGFGNCYRYYLDADKLVSVDFVAGAQTTSAHDLVIVNEAPPVCSAGN